MFLKNTAGITYSPAGASILQSVNGLQFMNRPKNVVGVKSGTAVVCSYLESFKLRTDGHGEIGQAGIDGLFQAALAREQTSRPSAAIPSLKSLADACVAQSYVLNAGVGWFNTADAFRYFMSEYKAAIVELKVTTAVFSAADFLISDVGSLIDDTRTKGFVACCYDSDHVLLQNTLGESAGIAGFHKMTWSVFQRLLVQGLIFTV